jgi:hypothetical protein
VPSKLDLKMWDSEFIMTYPCQSNGMSKMVASGSLGPTVRLKTLLRAEKGAFNPEPKRINLRRFSTSSN